MSEKNKAVITESAREGSGYVTLKIELPGAVGEYEVYVSHVEDEDAWEQLPWREAEPPRFFISYSSQDEATAKRLSKLLRETFLADCFCSAEALGAGEAWPSILEENLKTCDALLYLSSVHSNKSIWCQQEAAWALGSGTPVLPLLLDESPMRGALERLEHLPETDVAQWLPAGDRPSSRDWLEANRYVVRTVVAPVLSALVRQWRMGEGVAELLVSALEQADRWGRAVCVKDALVSALDNDAGRRALGEGDRLARIREACDRSAWMSEDSFLWNFVREDLLEFIEHIG